LTKALALTGGIGSGKSTVSTMFAELGVPILDLDVVGRRLLDDKHIQASLQRAFGEDVIDAQGCMNRQILADRAFNDASQTARLNAILHPEIIAYEQQWLKNKQAPYAMIEASVLLESGGVARMDGLIVVLANQALRKTRVLARGQQDVVVFEKIIARQCNDAMRRKHADYILQNNGSLESLQQQVIQLSEQLMREFV